MVKYESTNSYQYFQMQLAQQAQLHRDMVLRAQQQQNAAGEGPSSGSGAQDTNGSRPPSRMEGAAAAAASPAGAAAAPQAAAAAAAPISIVSGQRVSEGATTATAAAAALAPFVQLPAGFVGLFPPAPGAAGNALLAQHQAAYAVALM